MGKSTLTHPLGLEYIPVPDCRFESIHVDLVGSLPSWQGHTHLLMVVDRFSRWPEAYTISDTTKKGVAKTLIAGWISRFCMPAILVSDRGPQFVSQLWTEIAQQLGVQLRQTTSYHPQSNGMVEQFHRQLKASLSARLTGPDWVSYLPWVLLGIRATHKADMGASPAEMVYGAKLHLPRQFRELSRAAPATEPFLEDLQMLMTELKPVPTSHHHPSSPQPDQIPVDLRTCPMVFFRRDGHRALLSAKYDGLFQVLSREPRFFILRLGNLEDTVAIDRLKPATFVKSYTRIIL